MSRSVGLGIVFGCLALLPLASFADEPAETATPADFQHLGELVVGRWVGDVRFIANWPGQELGKGERVRAYYDYEWRLDRSLIAGTGHEGTQMVQVNFAYDPAAQRIRFFNIGTSGDLIYGILWKKDEHTFAFRIEGGGLPDGRAHSGTGALVFKTDGIGYTLQGQTALDGKDNDPLEDVYTRLDAQK